MCVPNNNYEPPKKTYFEKSEERTKCISAHELS